MPPAQAPRHGDHHTYRYYDPTRTAQPRLPDRRADRQKPVLLHAAHLVRQRAAIAQWLGQCGLGRPLPRRGGADSHRQLERHPVLPDRQRARHRHGVDHPDRPEPGRQKHAAGQARGRHQLQLLRRHVGAGGGVRPGPVRPPDDADAHAAGRAAAGRGLFAHHLPGHALPVRLHLFDDDFARRRRHQDAVQIPDIVGRPGHRLEPVVHLRLRTGAGARHRRFGRRHAGGAKRQPDGVAGLSVPDQTLPLPAQGRGALPQAGPCDPQIAGAQGDTDGIAYGRRGAVDDRHDLAGNRFGSQTSAAYGACLQLWNYVQMPALAVGMAVSSMAAQNIGARRLDRVQRIAVVGVLFNFLMTGTLVVLIYVFNRAVLGLFLPAQVNALPIAQHINAMVAWSFVLLGATFVLSSVTRASGAVVPPLVILFIALWCIRLPFGSLLMDRWCADALWISFGVGSVSAVLMSLAYYRYGGWRNAHMLSAAPASASAPAAKQG